MILVLALLCSCVAAGALEELSTEGTEALLKTDDKTLPYELTYTSASLSPLVGEPYTTGQLIIRSVDELETFRGDKISEKWAKYDDAFFEEHSLIVVQVAGQGSAFRALPGRLIRRSDGVYTLRVYTYSPEVVETISWDDSFIIEADEQIPADAELELY